RGRYADIERGAFGFILQTGGAHGVRARTDELEAGLLHRPHHFLVLGHEAVARENAVVAVFLRDLDDLANALDAFFLARAGVIGHAVHATRIGQLAQFRCQRVGIGDGILFRQQDAVAADAHLLEDVHGLLADRTATNDERL